LWRRGNFIEQKFSVSLNEHETLEIIEEVAALSNASKIYKKNVNVAILSLD